MSAPPSGDVRARPVRLRAIQGQPAAVEALLRALRSGRLHHAYLFAGPDGVGKETAARAMAAALVCETPEDGDACGVCRNCARVAELVHPDVHLIERGIRSDGTPEAQIKIEEVRTLQRELGLQAYEGGRRVVIVREAERMNESTANALLKTLEEPGPNTHFLLLSGEPHRLLATVLSRCQRVRFAPLERALVVRLVMDHAGLPEDEAEVVAGLAEGSVGRAVALAGADWVSRREATLQTLAPQRPPPIHAVLALAEDLARRKEDVPVTLHLARTWYRDLLLVGCGASADRLVHRDLWDALRAQAGALTTAELLGRLEHINAAERSLLETTANARLTLESLLLRLAGHSSASAA